MGDVRRFGFVAAISGIAIDQQGALPNMIQQVLDVFHATTLGEGKHHFALITIHGLKIGLFHFAGFVAYPRLSGDFDGRHVHGQCVAVQYANQLLYDDGPQQFDSAFGEVRQRRSAEGDASCTKLLVLTIER